MIDGLNLSALRDPARLAALAEYKVMEPAGNATYDDLATLAARFLRTRFAAVTLVDAERQWFKARIGIEKETLPIQVAFSPWAVALGETLVVPDAFADPRFLENAVVCNPPYVRFFAAAPLVTPAGFVLGTLSVSDPVPRPGGLSSEERHSLETLARQVVAQLELERGRSLGAAVSEAGMLPARASEERPRFLLALSSAVRALAEPGEIADTVTRLLGEHFRVNRTGFAEAQADQEMIVTTSEWLSPGMPSLMGTMRMSDYGPEVGRRMREGQPYLLTDADMDPGTTAQREAYAAIQLRAAVVVPLIKQGRLIALLWLNDRLPRAWTAEEVDLAGVVLNILWESVERARAEAALRQASALLQAVCNSSSDFIYAKDRDSRMLLANPATLSMIGRPSEEVLGRSEAEFHDDPEQAAIIMANDRRIIESGRGETVEEVFTGAFGFRIYSSTKNPLRDERGHIIGIVGVTQDITERKRAAEEVARLHSESRARLAEMETLLEVIPIGIGIALDRECRHIRANPALARLLDLPTHGNASKTAEEWDRPSNFRFTDEHDREIPGEELPMHVAAREGREVRDQELTIVHNDGRVVRLLEYAVPLFDEQGKPRGCVGAFVDITEHRETDERQRFLVRLDDAVRTLSDPDEIVKTAARLLGEHLGVDRCAYADVEADEDTFNVVGDYNRGVPSMVGRYTFTQYGQEVLRLMRANQPYVVEDIERHQPPPEDLSTYRATFIRAVICVPCHKSGKFVAGLAVHQKVPRHWKKEEIDLVLHVANRCWEGMARARVARVLKESEERFRALADNIAQLAWMADSKGSIFWYNQRWFDYTGMTMEQMQGWAWEKVHHPEHLQRVTEKWMRHLEAGEQWEDTFPLRGADGGYRWFLSRAYPIRDAEGNVLRWCGTNTDVTEQREAGDALARAKEEAESANQAKDAFLAALSHELRTPLTPVLMAAAALREEEHLSTEVRDVLGMIQRNIELEARLIDDLLDVTRINRGKLALRLQECDIHTLLALALEIVRKEAQARGLSVTLRLAAEHTYLYGDAARLQQVFWNLLKNAVKFTPPGGRIIVRSRNNGEGNLIVEVSDTGLGILPDALERIFLPFEQAGRTNDHRFGGLGLGLSISKTIVEMHHGSIMAESEGVGQGSTLRVELPLADRALELPAKGASSSPVAPANGRPLRLLVVEDHEPTLAVLSRLLNRAGHTVRAGTSIASALELAGREEFDAVVSDIGLPDGTGLDLMRDLHATYGLRGIALSGYGSEEDLRRSREAGFVEHLVKPVEFNQLRNALAQFTASSPRK